MGDKTNSIRINGSDYMFGNMSCYEAKELPTGDDIKNLAQAKGMKSNFLSDIIFFNPDNSTICHASLFSTLPQKEKIRLDESPASIVLFSDSEGPREISEIIIEGAASDLEDKIEELMDNLKVEEDKKITADDYRRLSQALGEIERKEGKIIVIDIMDDEDNALKLKITVKDLPKTISVEFTEDMGIIESSIFKTTLSDEVKKSPEFAVRLFYGQVDLSEYFADNHIIKGLTFTPVVTKAEIEEDKLVVEIAPAKMRASQLFYSSEYMGYLSELSEAELEKAKDNIKSYQEAFDSARNMSDLTAIKKRLVKEAQSGWQEGKSSYMISFERARDNGGKPAFTEDGRLAIIVNRVPVPFKFALEGDFPPEDKKHIESLFKEIKYMGAINPLRIDEQMDRVREYCREKGYKIKELKAVPVQDGTLHVVLNLRRWDALYNIVIQGEEITEERKKENAKLVEEIMMTMKGTYIRDEDLEAIKRKLARGMSRSDIKSNVDSLENMIATDPETGKTAVIFIVTEGKPFGSFNFGGIGGPNEIALQASVKTHDNGRGTSYGGSGTIDGGWGMFKFDNVDEIYFESLSLTFGTTVGSDEKIFVDVYEKGSQYAGHAQTVVGTDVTYQRYFANDTITLSGGNAMEGRTKGPELFKSYDGVDPRFRPHTSACYRKGNIDACISQSVDLGDATYGTTTTRIKYKIPLGKGGNVPFVILKGKAGVKTGDVPELEQFTQYNADVPFALSFTDGNIYFSKSLAAASAELAFVLNSWLAVKPVIVSTRVVGEHAAVTVGFSISLAFFEIGMGYRIGLMNMANGIDFGFWLSDFWDIPEELKPFFMGTLFMDEKLNR